MACHQGMGDHIVCNAIYQHYAKNSKLCFIPVQIRYLRQVRQMLYDIKGIKLLPIFSLFPFFQTRLLAKVLAVFKFKIVNLGYFGLEFRKDRNRFLDEEFYRQAGLPLDTRWRGFVFSRRPIKELKLFTKLGIEESEFILVHDDPSRGFKIQMNTINFKGNVVRTRFFRGFSVFDYFKVIARAKEIHCIESSFAHFIDSIDVGPTALFLHRYARPGVASSKSNQISYNRKWQIISEDSIHIDYGIS